MTDAQIIRNLRTNTPKSPEFERTACYIYRKWKAYLFKFGKKHPILSQEDVKDAYHEAIHGLIQAIIKGKFQPDKSSISSFLYAILSNKCLDKIRRVTNHKHSWEASLEQLTPDLPLASRSFLHEIIVEEEVSMLRLALNRMGAICRELILAMEYWGYKPDEVAIQLGYKDGKSASQAKYRCLKELRALMNNKVNNTSAHE